MLAHGTPQIAEIIGAADVIRLPYDEASQSGVAASAYAAGRPVAAAPIGGLVEQMTPNQTGIDVLPGRAVRT
jgi:hypothetical protein